MSTKYDDIFGIKSAAEFESLALKIFKYQYQENQVYHEFCHRLNQSDATVKCLSEIPFLPISFFKARKIITGNDKPEITFTSSGTSGNLTSEHHVKDVLLYQKSYLAAFEHFYGNLSDHCILALLPSYLEREGSSLIYMVDDLIRKSSHSGSGFYLDDLDGLQKKLRLLDSQGIKTILIGVSFALLDLIERYQFSLKHAIIMETGGMKGRRKEMVREELHKLLKNGFGVTKIYSEYGMTELLSQAYSFGDGIFKTPPWMKIIIRDTEDPLSFKNNEKTGGVNIIDLANINSCSFIATQDLGKVYGDGSFEILGRFDHSDIRGCNLMVI